MCLAIPGKIISISNSIATIDYGTERRKAKIVVGNYKIDDFVIVQGKIVIDKVPREQVQGWLELIKNET